MFKEYFSNILGLSSEMNWYELDFIDNNMEESYRLSIQSDELRKSRNFSFIVIIFYIITIWVNNFLNDISLVRSGYFLIGGIILEIILTLFSYYYRKNYLVFSKIKILRFLIVYFLYMIILTLSVNAYTLNIFLRSLYAEMLIFNFYYIYFMNFNYLLLVFIPIFNSFIIIFIQYTAFNNNPYYLFPELFANFPLQYCIFCLKKREITSKKVMFLKNYNSQSQFEYITKLVDVLNTMVISIKNEEILYLNQYGIDFLDNFYHQINGKRITDPTLDLKENELLITEKKGNKERFNQFLDYFFTNLILDQSNDLSKINNNTPITLSQILKEKMNSDCNLSNIFIKIGLFNYYNNEQFFEVYIRKVKPSDEVFEFLIYDISDIKNAEKTNAETKYKQKILAKIAHEFKTPLITIITLIQSLDPYHKMCNLEPSMKKKLSHVVNLSNYIIYLIQDIIQYVSVTQATKLKIVLSKINLKEVIDFCYEVLYTLVDCNENKSENVKTFLEYDDSIDDLEILSDENKVKQILLNLISNSVKFTTSGYIKIKSSLDYGNSSVVISIEDTGLGIKNEDFHLIFQENIQLNTEKDYNNKGSGLGLSISKYLANSLEHDLNFQSNYGNGSKFYLTIPIHQHLIDNKNGIQSECKSEIMNRNDITFKLDIHHNNNFPTSSNPNTYRSSNKVSIKLIENQQTIRKNFDLVKIIDYEDVLQEEDQKIELVTMNFNFNLLGNNTILSDNCIVVVDDHKLVRINTINLIKLTLSSLNINNFTIIEGSDGIDLLNIVRKDENGKIKCVFTDENMEYLNGSEAVKIIRKLEQNNKFNPQHIVSITAFEDNGTRNNILKSGVNSILSKPCSKTAIKSILQKIIN